MLDRLRRSYDELLEYSLQKIVRIELGLARVPNAVQNATNRLVRLPQEEAQTFPLGTSILEVYETSGHELLMLGEPGAGKSTMLFHLAQLLVQQAEQEEAHPFIFSESFSSYPRGSGTPAPFALDASSAACALWRDRTRSRLWAEYRPELRSELWAEYRTQLSAELWLRHLSDQFDR